MAVCATNSQSVAKSALAAWGYDVINKDLNDDIDGDFVYIGVKDKTEYFDGDLEVNSDEGYIKDLIIITGPARKFIQDSFDNGYAQTEGTGIADIKPPINPFKKNARREEKKSNILDKIKALFNRFYGLVEPVTPDEANIPAPQRYSQLEEGGLPLAAET